ncbi:MAG TPA: multiheme c-type cytochrome, partial [Tepidisphaeraceae bacterium]|nr:multiheme c-type cytochrome [Tepidisphaeraceae bacterium]
MPIPTDTFWNIRRLNIVFALSAVALFAITAASILQDYGRDWHVPQQKGRVWDAALTEEKIKSDLSPDKQKQRDLLDAQIAEQTKKIEAGDAAYAKLTSQMKDLDSKRATVEFRFNTQKSEVGVLESNLQDARAAGDATLASELEKKIERPRKDLAETSEELEAIKVDQKQLKDQRDKKTAELDALKKQKAKLVGDAELLEKKLESLQPRSIAARLSEIIRAAPLMGFINPADKVNQIVLPDVMTDVAFMKIPTIDRCTTCHVNIAKRDFTEDKILAYLEEQTATARKMKLPTSQPTKATDPVAWNEKPGAVAMPEFWHNWARQLQPDSVKKAAGKLSSMTSTVGKIATVKIDGKPLASFKYDATLNDPRLQKIAATQPAATTQPVLADPDLQSQVLIALMKAWYDYDPNGKSASSATEGKVTVDLAPTEAKNITAPRNAALRYPEELKQAMLATLDKKSLHSLLSRYRYALIDVVNPARKAQGLGALDPSPVNLAHPRMDLYVDVDSKHSFEAVGCTSCHDGSGQETDFVVAAHMPRDIYVDSKTGEPVLASQLVHQPPEENTIPAMSSMLEAIYPAGLVAPVKASALHIEVPEESTAEKPGHGASPTIDYVEPINGKKGKAITQFAYWQKTYEPTAPRGFELVYHEWDWPMRTPETIQANCVRCHVDAYDIKDEAPTVYEGRYLFTNLGCVNCHQMDSIPAHENRKVGTDLRHVTDKLSPAFINSWIWAPKSFRPSTKMPHFFMLENNSSDEELRRTRQEARAITEYLVRTAAPLPPKYKVEASAKGSAEAGRALFESLGCLACHQNLSDPTGGKRNNQPVTRGEQWIVNDLVKSGKLKAKITAETGKEPDDKAVTTEAQKLYDGMTYNDRQLYVLENLEQLPGATEVLKYPDSSPKPIFMHHGPELSGVGTKLLSGRTREQAIEWVYNWLKEPRHYSEYTVMPQLRLSDQQAIDLAEFLLAQTREANKPGDTWKAELTPIDSPKLIELTSLFMRARFSVLKSIEKADDDTELTALAIDALTTPVQPKDQATAIVSKMSKDDKRLVFLGKKLIAHYGCMSCHAINGAENITSPCANLSDWGQKQVSKLDYGYLDPHHVEEFKHEGAPNPTLMMVNGLCSDAQNIAHMKTDWTSAIASPVKPDWPDVEHTRDSWLR